MLGLIAAVLLWGCSIRGEPQQRALDRAEAAMFDGVDEGWEAVDALDEVVVRARYNPCRCPAPDFEVRIYGSWQRILVNGDTELVHELRHRASNLAEQPGLDYLRLYGQVKTPAVYEESGVEYDRFEVVDFEVE